MSEWSEAQTALANAIFDAGWSLEEHGPITMFEPASVVAEMRDQAEWQETALDDPFMATDMRGWADRMERLETRVTIASELITDLLAQFGAERSHASELAQAALSRRAKEFAISQGDLTQ